MIRECGGEASRRRLLKGLGWEGAKRLVVLPADGEDTLIEVTKLLEQGWSQVYRTNVRMSNGPGAERVYVPRSLPLHPGHSSATVPVAVAPVLSLVMVIL